MMKRILGSASLCMVVVCLSANAQTPGQTKINPKNGQTYVWIPAGSFKMGCSPDDHHCASDEVPVHNVEITKGFWMAQTPVTVGAWKKYGKATLPQRDEFGRKLNDAAGDPNLPVVEATWDDAVGYCSAAGMRLPTEAEWEYAARAGTTGATYGWQDSIAWYADNSGKKPVDGLDMYNSDQSTFQKRLYNNGDGPRPVKLKQPNAWGLYDILGNVWEWTADYYLDTYYMSSPAKDPKGPDKGTQRVLRGGAWNSTINNVRVSYRLTNPPGDRVNIFGFRCAGDLP
jgi:formylglycine-generating enzyme required for sulfatase activity